ncbi:membrane-associated tyrosine- and threonine-specific cdc2-inhibitory kinase [Caerostris darwini]|uniref:non-specific serine/threonine protein kinase n=1 Tax=Caerostris darwini TaxID=1538125 RepID=A0AAV4STN1_9ARAC|nr:membrane-associated tyrosine- and threonine-specific cdc2-inhibitory kinase [Caerostris darwini]
MKSDIDEKSSDVRFVKKVSTPLVNPVFYPEKPFSSKREKPDKSIYRPPPTPKASKWSFSSRKDSDDSRPRSISFSSKSSLSPLYDPTKDKLYFEQCYELIVYKVKSFEDQRYYAIKKAKRPYTGISDRHRRLREVQKLEQLPIHPNCVRFYGAWEQNRVLYIKTELCICSLSKYSEKYATIEEEIVWDILFDLLMAVKHLHDHELLHLDIKPDNIFISEKGICKLGDFGLMVSISESKSYDVSEGDAKYLAPEVLLDNYFSEAADIFSVGITVLELITDLRVDSSGAGWRSLREGDFPDFYVKLMSKRLFNLIQKMMDRTPTNRPSATNILNLDYLQEELKKRRDTIQKLEKLSEDLNSSVDDVFQEVESYSKNSLTEFLKEEQTALDVQAALNLSLSDDTSDALKISVKMSTPNKSNDHFLFPESIQDNADSLVLSRSKKRQTPDRDSPHRDSRPAKSCRSLVFDIRADDSFTIPPLKELDESDESYGSKSPEFCDPFFTDVLGSSPYLPRRSMQRSPQPCSSRDVVISPYQRSSQPCSSRNVVISPYQRSSKCGSTSDIYKSFSYSNRLNQRLFFDDDSPMLESSSLSDNNRNKVEKVKEADRLFRNKSKIFTGSSRFRTQDKRDSDSDNEDVFQSSFTELPEDYHHDSFINGLSPVIDNSPIIKNSPHLRHLNASTSEKDEVEASLSPTLSKVGLHDNPKYPQSPSSCHATINNAQRKKGLKIHQPRKLVGVFDS